MRVLAGYGKDDTQIMFSFCGGANNARLYAEVLAQAERDRAGKPVAALADRLAGHSAGSMLATFLTLPHPSDGRPLSAQGLPLGSVDPKFARVRVHLFHATRPEFQACAACSNVDGKHQTPCQEHAANLTRLVGRSVQAAKVVRLFDASLNDLPLLTLALNLEAGQAAPEMNAELTRIAHAQMIGSEEARTPAYTRLLAVLAEADGDKAESSAALSSSSTEHKNQSALSLQPADTGKTDGTVKKTRHPEARHEERRAATPWVDSDSWAQ